MLGKLVSGNDKWGFEIPRIILGRGQGSNIHVTDPSASRRHAELWLNYHDQYMVLDGGSRNGTYLNDQLVCGPTLLHQGDCIRIGEQKFEFLGNTSTQGSNPTSMIKVGETQILPKFPVVMLAIRLIDKDEPFKDEMVAYSCGLGQWFSKQMELIAKEGGFVNHLDKRLIFATWQAETGELAGAIGKAVACARKSLQITKGIDEEFKMALSGIEDQVLMNSVVALHLGKVEGKIVGSAEVQCIMMHGSEVENCVETTLKAEPSRDSIVCVESVSKLFTSYPKKNLESVSLGSSKQVVRLVRVSV
ncbi:MAG: FHA domain-containing protein [Blastochloris sp.]|jgi:pSer/pThr/pTyr-binding forkhead associated (FHA) protein|nr:FHA domain-containing protein [Blastochloris sp.]